MATHTNHPRYLPEAALLSGLILTLLAAMPASMNAQVGANPTWNQAPVILKTSEAVKPGAVFSLYGEGLPSGHTTITYHSENDEDSQLPVIQSDPNGQFARVLLPAGSSTEDATLIVQNPYGQTEVPVNQANPTWLSDEAAYPGLHLQIFGRNLDASEFGGHGRTQVRLVANGDDRSIRIDPDKITPFAVDFTVPWRAAPGTYAVQIRNAERAEWSTLPASLPIVAAKPNGDPLGLNVSWAQDFKWYAVYNVRRYRAVGNGSNDDTAAIQAGIEDVANRGGGVLYFPDGTYTFTRLAMRAGVVLAGQSRNGTILQYSKTGTGGPSAVVREGDAVSKGLFGVANMTFTLQPGTNLTSRLIMLDFEVPRSNYFNLPDDQQTSTRMFINGVTVSGALTDTHFGPACIIDAKDQTLIANSYFVGYAAVAFNVFLLHGATMRDNTIEYASGAPSNSTSNFIFERNHLIGHYIPSIYTQSSLHGVEESSDARPVNNLYWADNTVEGMNTPLTGNDGESMLVEPGGRNHMLMEGQIAGATSSTVTVAPSCTVPGMSFDAAARQGGAAQWQILITGGTGLGQERAIVSHSGYDVMLDHPWDVIPDQTSQFSILYLASNVVMEHNTIRNDRSALLLYSNVYDAVVADTTSTNTNGVWAKANASTIGASSNQPCYIDPVYFARMVRNTVSGPSQGLQNAWMGLSSFSFFNNGNGPQPAPTVTMYANELRDSSIDRAGFSDYADVVNHWGSEQQPAGFEAAFQTSTTGKGILASLFENDSVANSQDGIHLGSGVDSTLLHANPTQNVRTPFLDTGSTNTVTIP